MADETETSEEKIDPEEERQNSRIHKHFKNEALSHIPINLSVVLGHASLRVHQLLKLGRGAVVELDQKTYDPVELLANEIMVAKGEVTVTENEKLGVTLTELIAAGEDQQKSSMSS